MIAIDINQKQALDADPKAMHQTNFTGKLDRQKMQLYFILYFSQRAMRVLQIFFAFI